MRKSLILVRQRQNSEQNLIIIKAHTSPIEKKHKVLQQRFHKYYGRRSHNGIDDWQFTLNEQCETQLKERETFWQHRLKTFYPYELNEKKEYLY